MALLVGLAIQPVAAMEKAVQLDTFSETLPDTSASRAAVQPAGQREPSAPPTWEMEEQDAPPNTAGTLESRPAVLNWELVEPAVYASPDQTEATQPLITASPIWEPVVPGEEFTSVDVAREVEAQEAARQDALAELEPVPQEFTFGGFRDLFRGNRWYPSISTIVPMGFGPSGFMAGIGFSGADCRPESGTCTRYSTVSAESIREVSEAVLDGYLGFGDSSKAIGVLITQTSGSTFRSADRGSVLENMQTGFAISRNLGTNTAIKLGAEGALPWDSEEYFEQFNSAEVPKSAFAVVSHRIPLGPDNAPDEEHLTRWFSDLFITVGLGNGIFRPSDEVIRAQIREIKRAGCWKSPCTPERVKRARVRGSEWGDPSPIAALALAITDQLNLITEWTGRNLNISLSIQPFRNVGLTITPGIGNLVNNSDYNNGFPKEAVGCDNCDFGNLVTNRPIFYLRSMFSVRF